METPRGQPLLCLFSPKLTEGGDNGKCSLLCKFIVNAASQDKQRNRENGNADDLSVGDQCLALTGGRQRESLLENFLHDFVDHGESLGQCFPNVSALMS